MTGSSRRVFFSILVLLGFTSIGCCVRVSKTSDIEDLKARLAKAEQRADTIESSIKVNERVAALEARIAELSRAGAQPPASGQQSAAVAVALPAVPAQGSAAATPIAEHPERRGGEYRQGIGTDPPSLDPAHISDTTSDRVGLCMFEGLVEFNEEDLGLQPCIAKSWETSPDGTVFTFKLRDDVKFHNGKLVTADDFVYSFARLLEPKTASERTWLMEEVLGYKPFAALLAARGQLKFVAEGQFEKVEADKVHDGLLKLRDVKQEELEKCGAPDPKGLAAAAAKALAKMETIEKAVDKGRAELAKVPVEPELLKSLENLKLWDFISKGLVAPDKTTLRITLGRPFAPFLTILAMRNAAVVPKEEAEKWGDQFSQHPVGTGPFKFVKWDHAVAVELEAFDDYFLGRPFVDKMKFRVLPDDVARLNEFEIGNIESMNEIPDEKYEAIKANPNFPGVIDEMETLSTYYIGFNVTKKPFDNPLIRQAFNCATRKDTILNVIRRGRGSLANGVLPPGMVGYNKELKGYNYDKQRALDLLKQAGYPDPSKLGEIEFWYNATSANDPNAKLAEVIQQNLREIGVTTKLQSTDWATYIKKVDRGELGLFRMAWVADYPDADNFLYILFHSSMKGEGGNYAFYSNPKVDALLEKGRRTVDPKARVPLYQEAEKIIVEEAPWVFLYHAKQAFLHKNYVKGVKLTAMGPDAIRMRTVWLDKSMMKTK
ncbi:MAG: ABC transporter substrate-binding protein [Candidatus Wallbacteria bacterium]|nr:ABC transporter substrate-binding protein [Candidatus Wallbacteria bacterium]